MKATLILMASVVLLSAGSLRAEDKVPNSTLAKMGLSSIKVMSDSQGMQIRGRGFYFTSSSTTNILGSGTTNTVTVSQSSGLPASGAYVSSQSQVHVQGFIGATSFNATAVTSGYATASGF